MFSAPLTIFLQFDFALNLFFVFAGPVIQAFAFCALEFYEIWLRHIPSPCSVKCKIQNEKCKMIIQGVFYSIRPYVESQRWEFSSSALRTIHDVQFRLFIGPSQRWELNPRPTPSLIPLFMSYQRIRLYIGHIIAPLVSRSGARTGATVLTSKGL